VFAAFLASVQHTPASYVIQTALRRVEAPSYEVPFNLNVLTILAESDWWFFSHGVGVVFTAFIDVLASLCCPSQ